MKNLFTPVLLMLFSFGLVSAQGFEWVHQIGNNSLGANGNGGYANGEYATVVKQHGLGNIYIAGAFSGTNVDFNPSPNQDPFTSSPTGSNIFISQYSSIGAYVWTKVLTGGQMGPTLSICYDMEIDSQGNIIIVGQFFGNTDFDPGPGEYYLNTSGLANDSDLFVAKYTSNGDFIWAFKLGSNSVEYFPRIALGANNDIYVTGGFSGTVNFNPNGVPNTITASNYAAFLAHYTADGEFVWVHRYDGPQDDYMTDVYVDGDFVYTTGYFYGGCNFQPQGPSLVLFSYSQEDGFVTKHNRLTGELIFAKQFGGSDSDKIARVVVKNGLIYLAGSFTGNIDLDPGDPVWIFNSSGQHDAFICILDTDGVYQDSRKFGGLGTEAISSIVVNNSGIIHVSGSFQQTVNFGPSSLTTSGTGGFIVKIDMADPNDEPVQWVAGLIGSGSLTSADIHVSFSGDVFNVGYFSGSIDFNPGAPVVENTTTGPNDNDIYFLKLSGCPDIDLGINLNGSILSAAYSNATSYQWFNCQTGGTISGATNATYAPTSNGEYAVLINLNGCNYESECFTYNAGPVGIGEENTNAMLIYPNPVHDVLSIQSQMAGEVQVMSADGKILSNQAIEFNATISMVHLSSGVYFVRFVGENGYTQVMRVIKE